MTVIFVTVQEISKYCEKEIAFHTRELSEIPQNDPFRHGNQQYRIGALHALKDLLRKTKEQAE